MSKISAIFFKEPRFISPFMLSIVINVLFFTIFFTFITPGFETNDDAFMMMFSSGMLTGEPSEYLFFINILICKLLKVLYVQYSNIPWYETFFYAVHFLGMTALLYVFLKLQRNLYGIMIFTIQFVFFELLFLTHIQFTTTAFVIGFCGVILFHSSLNNSLKNKWLTIIIAFFLMVIAMLIRSYVLIGILILWLPVLGIKYFENRTIRIPIFVLCILISSFILNFYQKHYYENNLHKPDVIKYRQAIGYLANRPLSIIDESLNKVNWNRNDIILFQYWFWIDNKVFSEDKVIFISNTFKSYRHIKEACKLIFFEIFKAKRYFFLGLLCLVLIYILLPKKQLKYMTVILVTLIIIYFGLSFSSKMPERVTLSLLCFVCIFGFFSVLECQKKEKIDKLINNYFVIFLVVLFIFQVSKIVVSSEMNKANSRLFQKIVSDVMKDNKSLFVVAGPDFPYEAIPLFENPLNYRTLNILPAGWAINTPVYNKILERFHVHDLLSSLYEKHNIYILSTGWTSIAPYDKVSEQYSVRDLLKLLYKKDGYIYDKSNDSFFNALKNFYKDHYKLNVKFQNVKKDYNYIKPVRITLD